MCKLFIFREKVGLGCPILVFTDQLNMAWQALFEKLKKKLTFNSIESVKLKFELVRIFEIIPEEK